MNLEKAYKSTIAGLHKYMREKIVVQITAVFKHQHYEALHSVLKEAERYLIEAETIGDAYYNLPTHNTMKA